MGVEQTGGGEDDRAKGNKEALWSARGLMMTMTMICDAVDTTGSKGELKLGEFTGVLG